MFILDVPFLLVHLTSDQIVNVAIIKIIINCLCPFQVQITTKQNIILKGEKVIESFIAHSQSNIKFLNVFRIV